MRNRPVCKNCGSALDCAPEAMEIVSLLPVDAICTGCGWDVRGWPVQISCFGATKVDNLGRPVFYKKMTDADIARVEELAKQVSARGEDVFED